jgi:hypothetical protein
VDGIRLPVSVKFKVNNFINDIYEDEDVIANRKNSFFCSFSEGTTKGYGKQLVIIPLGIFYYSYIKGIQDLYTSEIHDIIESYYYEGGNIRVKPTDSDMIKLKSKLKKLIVNNEDLLNAKKEEICIHSEYFYIMEPSHFINLFGKK